MQSSNAKQHTINETLATKVTCNNAQYYFSKSDIELYQKSFDDFNVQGRIINSDFNSPIWILKDLEDNTTCKIEFDLEIYPDIMLALKYLVLDEIKKGYKNRTISHLPKKVLETIRNTNKYDVNYLNEYQDTFNTYGYRKQEETVIKNLQFNDFYGEIIPQEYVEFFQSISTGERKVRSLPSYENVITFDFILNDFINNCNTELRKKYLPIMLWWKITSIIPMRPIEFLKFKANCTFEKNNKYWIIVPREKQKGNSSQLEVTNVLRINKDTYDLVQEYLTLINKDEESEYLFSYLAYNNLISNPVSRKGALKKRLRDDKMGHDQFYELLDDFYSIIVEDMYGYKEIERIKAGDTRHFAFCNMMLQGFNMLTIARMGGHLHLNSQLGYCSHIDYFAEAKVKILADQIKKNRINKISDTYLNESNALIVRSKLYVNDGTGLKIGSNLCLDKEFPNNCIKNCSLCPHYVLDLSNPNTIKELKLKSLELDTNIKNVIKTMQNISLEMIYDLDTLSYSELDQERLNNLSNKLNKLFNEKAIIDSHTNEKEDI